jgi:hypothetical protein
MLATPSTSMFPQEISIFGLKVELLWQAIANKPEPSVCRGTFLSSSY